MRHLQLIAQGLDVSSLLTQINVNPGLWKKDTYHKDYPNYPFKHTETIYLRFTPDAKNFVHGGNQDLHECEWMDGAIHLPAARPFIFGLMAKLEAERLGRVIINKLAPGQSMFAHVDPEFFTSYWTRFHLSIQSAPGCICRCADEKTYMRPGEVWRFDNGVEHEVNNNSAVERIHMICDLRLYSIKSEGQTPTKPL